MPPSLPPSPLSALALVCTLNASPAESSSELLATQVLTALGRFDVTGETVRVVDHDVLPGVVLDVGDGDAWPPVRQKLVDADILVLATPTWMGQPSAVCQRVLEPLGAEISAPDAQGRPLAYGKVAVAAVVGNEDGAHHISGVLFQVLNDVGFTIPAGGVTYWNDHAMGSTDYKDLPETPEAVASVTATLASNAAHLARLLAADRYPPAS